MTAWRIAIACGIVIEIGDVLRVTLRIIHFNHGVLRLMDGEVIKLALPC